MTTGMETALFEALADCRATAHKNAVTAPWIASAWTALRSFATRSADRYRLGRSIAHLNDRLLADAVEKGLVIFGMLWFGCPRDFGGGVGS